MKPKIGQSFWDLYVEDGKVEFFEWVVTAIRRHKISVVFQTSELRAHMIHKASYTWVKRSTKRGDYGWAKHIPRWSRYYLVLNDDKSISRKNHDRMFSTKLAALKNEEKSIKNDIRKGFEEFKAYDGSIVTIVEQEKEWKKNLAAVRRRITLERNKRKKANANKKTS